MLMWNSNNYHYCCSCCTFALLLNYSLKVIDSVSHKMMQWLINKWRVVTVKINLSEMSTKRNIEKYYVTFWLLPYNLLCHIWPLFYFLPCDQTTYHVTYQVTTWPIIWPAMWPCDLSWTYHLTVLPTICPYDHMTYNMTTWLVTSYMCYVQVVVILLLLQILYLSIITD